MWAVPWSTPVEWQRKRTALVRAAFKEREVICEASRISFAPYAPPSRGLASPSVRRGYPAKALGIMRSFSRMVKDAARVEPPFLGVFDVRYDYLMKYNLPLPGAVVARVDPNVTPLVIAKPPRASKPGGMVSVQTMVASPAKTEGKYRQRGAPRSSRTRFSETPRRGASPMAVVVARAVVLVSRFLATPLALWAKSRVMSVSALEALVWMAKVRCAHCARLVI